MYFGLMLDRLHGLRTQRLVEIFQLTLSEGNPACDLPDHSATEEANGKWKQPEDSLPKHTSNPSYSANVIGIPSCPFYGKYVMLLIILDAPFRSFPLALYPF